MYQIAICDDEPELLTHYRALCADILSEQGLSYKITAFSSASALLQVLTEHPSRFHLLLLDIGMDGLNGMQLAHTLRAAGNRVSIIFMTAYDSYLLEGYEVQPLHYLLKPVTRDMLAQALTLDLRLNHQTKNIIFETGKKRIQLDTEQCVYLESMSHNLYIHTPTEVLTLQISLTKAIEALPADRFCRCHKSFLVNLSYISSISRSVLLLTNGTKLPVGRSFAQNLQSEFVRYLNRM